MFMHAFIQETIRNFVRLFYAIFHPPRTWILNVIKRSKWIKNLPEN